MSFHRPTAAAHFTYEHKSIHMQLLTTPSEPSYVTVISPPCAGGDDTKQTDTGLESFDFFHDKEKEKEDDLHKSYNDRSYLSSEDMGPGESRSGEQHRRTKFMALKMYH